ncbi:MAG: lytic transglycosylase domain-containing protein [Candidatus Wallbacteria bacterium]|nr:lytic transglycosylase domain-containing protein [Candidatus Wallbacteria bacterium]
MRLLWAALALVPVTWYWSFAPLVAWSELLGPVRAFKEGSGALKAAGAGKGGERAELGTGLANALEWSPGNPFVHLYLGLWYAMRGQKQEAVEWLRRSSELARGELGAFFDLVILRSLEERPGPPVSREELAARTIAAPECVRLMPVALFRRELDLAARLIARAAEQDAKGFDYQRHAGLFQWMRDERQAAWRLLERAWIVRSTAGTAPGYGLGFIPYRVRLQEGAAGMRAVFSPWLGIVTTSTREVREATAELLFNLVVLCRAQESYRRSLQLAELLAEKFQPEVAELGLGWHLDRYLYPRNFGRAVEEKAARVGLDPYLVHAVIREESHYDAGGASPVGALGLMQLMPETGRWVALRLRLGAIEDRELKQPFRNIELGSWYLSHLARSLPAEARTVEWVLAAYNAGPGNAANWLARWRKSGGDPLAHISFPETRRYVTKVRRAYDSYRRVWAPPAAPPGD